MCRVRDMDSFRTKIRFVVGSNEPKADPGSVPRKERKDAIISADQAE